MTAGRVRVRSSLPRARLSHQIFRSNMTFTKKQAAALLGISPRTLDRRMKAGVYKFTRTGEGQFAELSFTHADLRTARTCASYRNCARASASARTNVRTVSAVRHRTQGGSRSAIRGRFQTRSSDRFSRKQDRRYERLSPYHGSGIVGREYRPDATPRNRLTGTHDQPYRCS